MLLVRCLRRVTARLTGPALSTVFNGVGVNPSGPVTSVMDSVGSRNSPVPEWGHQFGNNLCQRLSSGRKKKHFYVVFVGLKPGIYQTWEECRANTEGVAGCRHEKFDSMDQAKRAWEEGLQKGAVQTSTHTASYQQKKGVTVINLPKEIVAALCNIPAYQAPILEKGTSYILETGVVERKSTATSMEVMAYGWVLLKEPDTDDGSEAEVACGAGVLPKDYTRMAAEIEALNIGIQAALDMGATRVAACTSHTMTKNRLVSDKDPTRNADESMLTAWAKFKNLKPKANVEAVDPQAGESSSILLAESAKDIVNAHQGMRGWAAAAPNKEADVPMLAAEMLQVLEEPSTATPTLGSVEEYQNKAAAVLQGVLHVHEPGSDLHKRLGHVLKRVLQDLAANKP